MGWLIDTCLWIEVERGRLEPSQIARLTARDEVYLSPVTISELQYGVEMATDPGRRAGRRSIGSWISGSLPRPSSTITPCSR